MRIRFPHLCLILLRWRLLNENFFASLRKFASLEALPLVCSCDRFAMDDLKNTTIVLICQLPQSVKKLSLAGFRNKRAHASLRVCWIGLLIYVLVALAAARIRAMPSSRLRCCSSHSISPSRLSRSSRSMLTGLSLYERRKQGSAILITSSLVFAL